LVEVLTRPMPDRFLSASLFRSSLISPQKLAVTALSAEAARLRHRHNAPRCCSASRRSAHHRHSSRSLRSSSWFILSSASVSLIARNSASTIASRENREGCKTPRREFEPWGESLGLRIAASTFAHDPFGKNIDRSVQGRGSITDVGTSSFRAHANDLDAERLHRR